MPPEMFLDAFRLKNQYRLYPHTPIELECDNEDKESRRYQIFVEGQWDSWESTLDGVSIRLREITSKLPSDVYDYVGSRLNPDWEGWRQIERTRNA